MPCGRPVAEAARVVRGAFAILLLASCVPAARSPAPEPARDDSAAAARAAEAARAAARRAADSAAFAAAVPSIELPFDDRSPIVRIALATAEREPEVSGTGAWHLLDGDSEDVIVNGRAGEPVRLVRSSLRLRVARNGDGAGAASSAIVIARPAEPFAFLVFKGKRYRGELAFVPSDSGVLVVNHLPLEQYLRGVVPLEIGDRTFDEREAVAAQAVAARSYAYIRVASSAERPYDMVATVFDQVYGGADAEKPVADAAILETWGLVLWYAGRIVNTPYSSTCGGTTAEAPEVWRSSGEPYLQRVSDRVPGTDRFYCDISPRFRWTRSYSGSQLSTVLQRYLRSYAAVPAGRLGAIRNVETQGRTESGRTQALVITTERGRYRVLKNDARFVLRSSAGEILNSTYYSVRTTISGGVVTRLDITGSGYGHGVGMCQWGAIGRARAGQDFRTILGTYYPGTIVAPAE